MAITRSAKKEIRASARKRVFNLRVLRKMRLLTKETKKVALTDPKQARTDFVQAQKAIDKAAKRGVIKPKTAARRKSVLARTIKQNG